MRKRMLKAGMAAIMILTLVFSDVGFSHVVYAEENGNAAVQTTSAENWEEQAEWMGAGYEEDDDDDEGVVLWPEADDISLGTVYEGDHFEEKEVRVFNEGDEGGNICWSVADPNGAFNVNIHGSSYVRPGEAVTFGIAPKANVKEGRYSGSIFIGVDDSINYGDGF